MIYRRTLNKINCIVQSKCRTWNSTTRKWSTAKTPTSNPASVVLELLQSKTLGLNAYPDSMIDLESFGNFYEFCENHTIRKATPQGTLETIACPFRVSGVLTKEQKLIDVINIILGNARSFLTLNGNKYSIVTDKSHDLPVTILNNHNILKDGLSNTKNFNKPIDGYIIKFVNERLNYEYDTIKVYRDGVDKNRTDLTFENIELNYVTDPNREHWTL